MPRIMKSMNMIARCQALYRGERLPAEDLAPSHFGFLLCTYNSPGLTQEQIADRLCLNKSTVARGIAYLEEHGYVKREISSEDKRAMRVYPTEKTQAVIPHVRECNDEWNSLITEGISEGELSVFRSVLLRIEESAKMAVKPTRVTKKEEDAE